MSSSFVWLWLTSSQMFGCLPRLPVSDNSFENGLDQVLILACSLSDSVFTFVCSAFSSLACIYLTCLSCSSNISFSFSNCSQWVLHFWMAGSIICFRVSFVANSCGSSSWATRWVNYLTRLFKSPRVCLTDLTWSSFFLIRCRGICSGTWLTLADIWVWFKFKSSLD